jgi:predicted O-methyltransferase YrrM
MGKRSLVSEAVENYVSDFSSDEGEIIQRLREQTAALPNGTMQIWPDQAAFMRILVAATGVRRALEIGTFTGYSALSIAAALPPEGRLICCDVSEEWTSIARRYWREAGLDHKIELRLGPATQTLEALLAAGHAETFDFAFIDADKPAYDTYYELCLKLLRSGGLVALDNMLWRGQVADPHPDDADALPLQALNEKIRTDPRVEACLLTLGDGVLLARKR